jgi:hypothetical protein
MFFGRFVEIHVSVCLPCLGCVGCVCTIAATAPWLVGCNWCDWGCYSMYPYVSCMAGVGSQKDVLLAVRQLCHVLAVSWLLLLCVLVVEIELHCMAFALAPMTRSLCSSGPVGSHSIAAVG